MGEPVKIYDLACDMIRLCGLEPDVDIPIHITGLRPGEKMHEVLTNDEEILEAASCEGMSIVHRPEAFSPGEFKGMLRRLQQLVSTGDHDAILHYLGEIVPGFASQRLLAEVITDTADTDPVERLTT
jgi:FlaA1/EpsC-like NDP-sugar epimerase